MNLAVFADQSARPDENRRIEQFETFALVKS
jgi:hypothetical protein